MESFKCEGRVTIYTLGMFGYNKAEGTKLEVTIKPYAQYPVAAMIVFVPKGKRKNRCFVDSNNPSTVILEGWGHPDPASWLKPTDGGSISRYSSYSPEWVREFNVFFAEYLAKEAPKVLADYRSEERKAVA